MTCPLTSTQGTVHLHKSRHLILSIWKCTRRDHHRRPKVQRVKSKDIKHGKKKEEKRIYVWQETRWMEQANRNRLSWSDWSLVQLERVQSIRETGSPAPFESRNLCETNLPYLDLRRGQHGIKNKILTLTKSKTPAHRLKFGHWRQPRWCMTVRW